MTGPGSHRRGNRANRACMFLFALTVAWHAIGAADASDPVQKLRRIHGDGGRRSLYVHNRPGDGEDCETIKVVVTFLSCDASLQKCWVGLLEVGTETDPVHYTEAYPDGNTYKKTVVLEVPEERFRNNQDYCLGWALVREVMGRRDIPTRKAFQVQGESDFCAYLERPRDVEAVPCNAPPPGESTANNDAASTYTQLDFGRQPDNEPTDTPNGWRSEIQDTLGKVPETVAAGTKKGVQSVGRVIGGGAE